jgi:hypothetical protein
LVLNIAKKIIRFGKSNKNIRYIISIVYLTRLIDFLLIFILDKKTRWSSTYNILKYFLYLWLVIRIAIGISDSKIFKNKYLILKDSEISYLEKVLKILEIFTKATTKLQAEVYPAVYYIIPEIYEIYNCLDLKKKELNINFQILTLR